MLHHIMFLPRGFSWFQISSSLSSKFNGPIQALNNLKKAIEAEIGNFRTSTSIVECCQARGTTYNSRFRSTVLTFESDF
jgi:hypothetical protein